jgi:hypothetical protein
MPRASVQSGTRVANTAVNGVVNEESKIMILANLVPVTAA